MSLELISLRKLLKIMGLVPNRQIGELRADIRGDFARAAGEGGGGDFYGVFWSAAKDHVFGRSDLPVAVRGAVDRNGGRGRLYPILQDGFLEWWNERRRWTNEPFEEVRSPRARYSFEGLGTVKVENLLAVRGAQEYDYLMYPYFSEAPRLTEDLARLGLWIMTQALPNADPRGLRILDVIRGRSFSLDRQPLTGTEEAEFRRRYSELLARWRTLREEYV